MTARQPHLASEHRDKNPQRHVADSDGNHEQLSTETLNPGRKGGEHHGLQRRRNASPSGTIGQVVGVRRHKFPTGYAQVTSPSAGTTMDKQISHLQPLRRTPVNTQRRTKETRTEYLPGHVGRAMNAHELVTNNNPSIQEGKETPGHSTRHQ